MTEVRRRRQPRMGRPSAGWFVRPSGAMASFPPQGGLEPVGWQLACAISGQYRRIPRVGQMLVALKIFPKWGMRQEDVLALSRCVASFCAIGVPWGQPPQIGGLRAGPGHPARSAGSAPRARRSGTPWPALTYYAARNNGYTVPRAASFAGKALALAQDPRQGLSPPHRPYRQGRTAAPRRTLPRTVRSGRDCRLFYAPHSMLLRISDSGHSFLLHLDRLDPHHRRALYIKPEALGGPHAEVNDAVA
jgi:hypothetical protein